MLLNTAVSFGVNCGRAEGLIVVRQLEHVVAGGVSIALRVKWATIGLVPTHGKIQHPLNLNF